MGGRAKVATTDGLARTFQALAPVLATHQGDAMVIGGIASIAHGGTRTTRDVDVSVWAEAVALSTLFDELVDAGFEARIADAVSFAEESDVLLMRHRESGVELDVSLARLPVEREALSASMPIEIAGTTLPVIRVDDLVILKSIAARPQDFRDIEQLLLNHGERIDVSRVRRWVRALGEAIEVDRLSDLDKLLERTRKP